MMRNIAIIDYGAGNLRSVVNAFERAANDAQISAKITLTDKADVAAAADSIVLPGVGAFADCATGLHSLDGMVEAINDSALNRAVPFLGICVGMQLMAKRGLEKVTTNGLGWIDAEVERIKPSDSNLKIPQMGWNTLDLSPNHLSHELFSGIQTGNDGLHAYFVHSFHMADVPKEHLVATAPYGGALTAAIARDNMFGTQFHPEKSQALGLKLLTNFLNWKP